MIEYNNLTPITFFFQDPPLLRWDEFVGQQPDLKKFKKLFSTSNFIFEY